MGRWIGRHRRACQVAVSLLILALLPTPWPKVEFHNVRHHDAPGQVCEYHDHLLRWHPGARAADDVAVLHWHWAWPPPDDADPGHDGDGPRLHAHLGPDGLPATDPGSVAVADTASRPAPPTATAPPLLQWGLASAPPDIAHLRPPDWPTAAAGTPFAPRASLTARLHRWTC